MVDNELKYNTRNNNITMLVDPPDSFRFRFRKSSNRIDKSTRIFKICIQFSLKIYYRTNHGLLTPVFIRI